MHQFRLLIQKKKNEKERLSERRRQRRPGNKGRWELYKS